MQTGEGENREFVINVAHVSVAALLLSKVHLHRSPSDRYAPQRYCNILQSRQAQLCEISLGLKHRPQSVRWITQKSRVHSEVLVNYFGSAAFGIMSEKVKNYFSAFCEHGIRTQRRWCDDFLY